MTNKQQALEELMAVMVKWDIHFIAYNYAYLETHIGNDTVLNTFQLTDTETIQTELNRMKKDD